MTKQNLSTMLKDVIEHHLDSHEFNEIFMNYTITLVLPMDGKCVGENDKNHKDLSFKDLGRARSDYFQLLTLISDIQKTKIQHLFLKELSLTHDIKRPLVEIITDSQNTISLAIQRTKRKSKKFSKEFVYY